MNRIRRVAVALATALPLGTALLLGAAPAQADAVSTGSGDVITEARCRYTVTANRVAVRTHPDTSARVIKYKNRGNVVTGPCRYRFNDGRWWTNVYLGGGGTAWMAAVYLR